MDAQSREVDPEQSGVGGSSVTYRIKGSAGRYPRANNEEDDLLATCDTVSVRWIEIWVQILALVTIGETWSGSCY
eukprot:16445234-Heterocapsa_arctica.AAC.1